MAIAAASTSEDATLSAILNCYPDLASPPTAAEGARLAGVALAGQIELNIKLLTLLVKKTGKQPAELIQPALR
jgi:hypothetical protein